jgi:hypothetical protein
LLDFPDVRLAGAAHHRSMAAIRCGPCHRDDASESALMKGSRMDAHRFDRFTRALTLASTRRQVTRGLAGLAFGGAIWSTPTAARKKKPKKSCGPCRVKKRGKCKGSRPSETPCKGDGRCFAGTCIPKPACLGYASDCSNAGSGPCCSGTCLAGIVCGYGGPESTCLSDLDCEAAQGLSCVAFRCRPPVPPM